MLSLAASVTGFAGSAMFAPTRVAAAQMIADPPVQSMTVTKYVENLEATVRRLSSNMGVAMPQRCIGDACLSMESYIEVRRAAPRNAQKALLR